MLEAVGLVHMLQVVLAHREAAEAEAERVPGLVFLLTHYRLP